MKFLITTLLMLFVFDCNSQSNLKHCSIENVNKFLQEIVTNTVHEPGNLRITVLNGETPLKKTCYRHNYKRNGELKDSSLYSITKWNADGTVAMSTTVAKNGEIRYNSRYTYENNDSDSIVTSLRGIYGNEKYYFNQKNQVYKYESSNDTNFRSIKQRHLYYYDEKGDYIKAEISNPSSSSSVSIYEWLYDPKDFSAKTAVHGRLNSLIVLHKDSCYIEVIYEKGFPSKIYYYIDYLGNVFKEIEFYETKKGIEYSTILYERDNKGTVTRIVGDYFYEGNVDESYKYNSNGLLVKRVDSSMKKKINYFYYYTYKN